MLFDIAPLEIAKCFDFYFAWSWAINLFLKTTA